MEIAGVAALVTGGGSGLGEATARHLHALGARVVLFDLSEQKIRALASELGEHVSYVVGDASIEADAILAVDRANAIGPLRIAVACAGGGDARPAFGGPRWVATRSGIV
jgi:NAD(P)-dependent dehydrogenase (short-subunit alcohol dehydrogenase family)